MNTQTNNKSLFYRTAAVFMIVMMLLAAMPVSPAYAAATPATNASAGANVNGPGTIAWTNPGNITTVGAPYATSALTGNATSEYLQGTGYGFAIPGTATINGITVTINRQSDSNAGGNSINDVDLNLLKAGAITGTDHAVVTDWPIAMGTATYGGAADLWGTTWTPAQINAANFGVALSVLNQSGNARTASVDYIQITVTYTVASTPSTTTITSDTPDPSVVGQSLAVNFTVTAGATGNVTVSDGVNNCVGTVAAGTCNLALATAGARTLTATYAGDATYAGSVSAGAPHTVTKADTTINITNAAALGTASVVGQAYAVNYTVAVTAPGAGAPTGNVTVSDGVATCTATAAAGTCNLASTSVGAKTITATYAGDANFNTSTSAGVAHTVNKANTTTTINSDTPDPSLAGANVVVNFTVAAAAPGAGTRTGNVTVTDGVNSCIGAVTAPGTGTCTLALTTAGARTLTATYAGDTNFNGSVSAGAGHNVTASFIITASAGAGGTITPTGAVALAGGANQTFSSTPASTFILSDVLVDSVSVGRANSYAFNAVAANHTIAASYNGGWFKPTTSAVTAGAIATVTNAYVSDDVYTTTSGGGNIANYATFGLPAIPAGATINGIEVAVEGYVGAAPDREARISLSWDNGTTFTAFKQTDLVATDSTVILGGPADKWGRATWANTDFTDANFVLRFANAGGAGGPIYIDQFQVKVTYTVPAVAPTINSTNATIFTVGVAGNFNVTATGSPASTFTEVGALPAGVTLSAAGVLSGTPAAGTVGSYPITITASNGTPPNATQGFTLTVQKANTTTTISSDLPDPSLAGQNVVVNYAAVATVANAITPTGNVTVGDGVDSCVATAAAGTCTLSLTTLGARPLTATYAGDANFNGSASASAAHTVNATPPTITSGAPAGGTKNVVYSHTYTANGTAPITFSVTSGTLPTGLTLSSAGLLSGTPTAVGVFTGVVTATNGTAPDATQSFSIAIVAVAPTITSAPPSNGTQGVAYSHTYTASGTTPITYSVTSGALPNGLTLTSGGALSGTPTVLGTFTGVVTATNGTAPDATQAFSITISLSPAITSANNTSFTLGTAGSFTVIATGSPAPTLSMSGALPAGVTFNSGTGVLAGTPAAGTGGTYNLVFTATNGVIPDAVQNFTLTVTEGPSITSADNTSFSLGVSGSFTVTAVGFPAPTLSMTGTLPAGVTFTPGTGVLAGTPSAVGSYPLVFTAANGTLPNAVQNFTLTVKNGPVVSANGINSVPDTGNGSISNNESILSTLGITQLKVQFDQNVYDPAGNTDPKDVTNPANYMLVLGSSSGVFQTVSCFGGVVGPDVAIAVDSVTYNNSTFVATLNINGGLPLNATGFYRLYVCGTTSITDAANVIELAGDGVNPGTDFLINFRIQEPGSSGGGNNNGSSSTASTKAALIPVTGFAPGKITDLPVQPLNKAYKSLGELRIEIPTLGINYPIVGARLDKNTWDLTWLKDSVAYLEGSAYPTLPGNTVLSAHVVDANNNLGPFSDIKGMQLGQKIYIHINGEVYVYQVQENKKILPSNISAAFKHEDYSWITLVTCENYNAKTGLYTYRRMVRAVLVSVISEK